MSDTGNGRAGGNDVVIVVGGSAGAVLARLSEGSNGSVPLLKAVFAHWFELQAERPPRRGTRPDDPEHDWGYTARWSLLAS